ncbi:D-alanyl-D-alanine carboxypeptidase family protein [Paenibacillus harenae]|uniref:D-alanyl-D-alanine dipeptidase/carboxypeptidase n=1 Tax=Paenibacillus harenae TaxID=306543 RepID=A0ABT9U9B7_PAEHA|nr:D-alanyl-D-alanine carboxypeptidase family protein [Paenibacillus harenae]MDQ0062203.1 D-alanyl-D-alanine dipeptidase/carboxypeptidase [Paenibacillus harenae]MDQ0114789.1 D-alanyl-D-alanine dipeptidase/carboxypeptidase [Paenibacillus harenae]
MTHTTIVSLDSTFIHAGPIVLVNGEHPVIAPPLASSLIPVASVPSASAEERQPLLERTCLRQLEAWLAASGASGSIGIVSGYRTREQQQQIYERSLAENGFAFTSSYVALPNRSEHQTGLAVDLSELADNVDYIRPSLPDHGVFAAFKRMAASFGFIQRYKEGFESMTGIACEPWHYRYVGAPHSLIMERHNWCLEQYIAVMRRFTADNPYEHWSDGTLTAEVYYAKASETPETTIPIGNAISRHEWSGNNSDGFIVTVWRGQEQMLS